MYIVVNRFSQRCATPDSTWKSSEESVNKKQNKTRMRFSFLSNPSLFKGNRFQLCKQVTTSSSSCSSHQHGACKS